MLVKTVAKTTFEKTCLYCECTILLHARIIFIGTYFKMRVSESDKARNLLETT